MKIAIFGAQAIALGTYKAIKCLYPQVSINCFIVSNIGDNPSSLEGVSVYEIDEYVSLITEKEKKEVQIIIATPENVMDDIEKLLDRNGLNKHKRITSVRWGMLMGDYYSCQKSFIPLNTMPIGYIESDIQFFMAKFYRDQELKSDYQYPDYIKPIQVGAALTDIRVADVMDCEGVNISKKNVNYSELTALFWMWKNVLNNSKNYLESYNDLYNKDYYGLVHYRRVLDLTKDDLYRLKNNDIDVVLPYPMPYEPNINEHHRRYIKDSDWETLKKAIKRLHPEYYDKIDKIFGQQYFYNYNIMLAKKEVLCDFCNWLFPILETVEELSEPKGCDRQDRYIGYMGENLTTLYFMANKDKYNIVHAICRFLS